jgi:toxin ParE1/3/4
MVRLKWTPRSIQDLESIAQFISLDSIRYAKLTIKALRARAQSIKRNPAIGRVVPETNRPDIREIFQGNYRIVYWIEDRNTIHILTVHHSARLLSNTILK